MNGKTKIRKKKRKDGRNRGRKNYIRNLTWLFVTLNLGNHHAYIRVFVAPVSLEKN